MNPPARNVAHTKRLTADNEAAVEAKIPSSDETTHPDRKSPPAEHVSDDAAGAEGIDDPAVDD
jgi:hypothetical protein